MIYRILVVEDDPTIQRELVTLGGVCREPQEIPLALQGRAVPLALLAWAGTLLLLGAPPERLQGP